MEDNFFTNGRCVVQALVWTMGKWWRVADEALFVSTPLTSCCVVWFLKGCGPVGWAFLLSCSRVYTLPKSSLAGMLYRILVIRREEWYSCLLGTPMLLRALQIKVLGATFLHRVIEAKVLGAETSHWEFPSEVPGAWPLKGHPMSRWNLTKTQRKKIRLHYTVSIFISQ